MGKMVGIAEFKAKCERLLVQMEQDGEPIQLTRRGKVVAVINAPMPKQKHASALGALKGMITIHGDIVGPSDPDWDAQWEGNNPAELYSSATSGAKP